MKERNYSLNCKGTRVLRFRKKHSLSSDVTIMRTGEIQKKC